MKIGIVGYSTQKFNIEEAKRIIKKEFDKLEENYGKDIEIVSGLTAMGIPLLAYQEAKRRGWKSVGIACKEAFQFKLFPVDKQIIVGEKWGDESETFLNYIDILIRIGGGEQSKKETALAKKKGIKIIEYNL